MAIDSTILVTNVAPVLYLHEYSVYDLAALYAVANRENQVLEQQLVKEEVPPDSDLWMATWCKAGVHRLAFDRGISVSQMNKALAKAERDGLIEVRANGSYATRRRINKTALRYLRPETKIEMRSLFNSWKATAKTKEKFGLGPLDWTDYVKPEDSQNAPLSDIQVRLIREIGSIVLVFRNTFDRDRAHIFLKDDIASRELDSTAFTETELKLIEKYLGANNSAIKKGKPNASRLKLCSCLRISHPESDPKQDDFDMELCKLNALRNAAFDAAAQAADANRELNYLTTVGAEIPLWWASHHESCANRLQVTDTKYKEAQRHYIAKGGDPRIAQGPTPGDVTAAWIKIEDARADYEKAEATHLHAQDDLRLHLLSVPVQLGEEKVHAARTRCLEETIALAGEREEAMAKAYEDARCDAHLYIGGWVGERQGCSRATARVLHSRREVAANAADAADGEAWEAEEAMRKNPTPANKEQYQRMRQVAGEARDELECANIAFAYLHPGEFGEAAKCHKDHEAHLG